MEPGSGARGRRASTGRGAPASARPGFASEGSALGTEGDHGGEELGDLSDVPPERLEEVRDILEELRRGVPGGGAGGYGELRQWLHTFNHITGFSREATLQLCGAMARCLIATRSGQGGQSSTSDLQQTFVRMGGVKHIVNALVGRLSDAQVVAACLRVLSAICQGSPVAAQDLQDEGNTMRLLLRTIERHQADDDVAEAGCVLIGHLCAPVASAGAKVVPTVAASNRSCQQSLAEVGALDLLLELIAANLTRIAGLAAQAQEIQAKAVRAGQLVPKKGADNAKGKVERVKASMEVKQLWERYNAEEAAAARITEAALHSLTLIATGNEPTTRMIAGALWCWSRRRQREAELAALGEEESRPGSQRSRASRASGGSQGSRGRRSQLSLRSGSSRTSQGSANSVASSLEITLPEGDARQSLTTLESFVGTVALISEVLHGHIVRDRPGLATRACRLLTMLARHQLALLERLVQESEARAREMEVRLRRDPVLLDDRRPEAPFAPLQPLIVSLTHTMRSHLQDAPLLTAALETVAQLREVALMSVPAGVQPRGEEAKAQWRKLLAEAEEAGEIKAAGQALHRALRSTEVADQRISNFRINPNELRGDGIWLTPRMKAAAQESTLHAANLAGEIVAAAWHSGDPKRVQRKNAPKESPEGRRRRRSSLGVPRRGSRASEASQSPTNSRLSSKSGSGAFDDLDPEPPEDPSAPAFDRALGYFEHDEADFQRVWHDPLKEVLSRAFSCPEIAGRSERARAPDSLDELLKVQLMQSVAGRLRARAVVQPRNKWHQKVSEQRVRDFEGKPGVSAQVAKAISKDLRKAGYMLPKYGIQVAVRQGRRDSVVPQAILEQKESS